MYKDINVLKTYAWINDTASSKRIKSNRPTKIKLKTSHETPTIGLLISTINKCPATIFAANRTDRVKGRITLLINSIMTMNGIKG